MVVGESLNNNDVERGRVGVDAKDQNKGSSFPSLHRFPRKPRNGDMVVGESLNNNDVEGCVGVDAKDQNKGSSFPPLSFSREPRNGEGKLITSNCN
jgi:hypothetical protein